MPDEREIIKQIRSLALDSPHSTALVKQLIEYWAARQDIQVRSRLLQSLVLKYAATEKEFFRVNQELIEKQQRLEEDLAAAAEIQLSLLPRKPAEYDHFDAAWEFKPSAHIGGDLFNIMRLDEHCWGIYALDVGGHGVPAAMVAVSVFQNLQPHSMFLRRADARLARGYSLRTPGQVLQALDKEYPFERFSNFFTMVYLILDVSKRTLRYSNAGHPHPILVRRGGDLELLKRGGPFIGLRSIRSEDEKEKPFFEEEVRFDPGDKLLIYTDGLIEYHNKAEVLYGKERLMDLLRSRNQTSVGELVDSICASLEAFGDGNPPVDDVTLLGIELKQ